MLYNIRKILNYNDGTSDEWESVSIMLGIRGNVAGTAFDASEFVTGAPASLATGRKIEEGGKSFAENCGCW